MTTITLDESNSIPILAQYIELAQQKGAYLLSEAELLKRAKDVLLDKAQDVDVNPENAKQVLIQGIHKGQRHGAYTLNDAALLHKVVLFVTKQVAENETQVATNETQVASNETQVATNETQVLEEEDDDLADLAEPIPLRPKEV